MFMRETENFSFGTDSFEEFACQRELCLSSHVFVTINFDVEPTNCCWVWSHQHSKLKSVTKNNSSTTMQQKQNNIVCRNVKSAWIPHSKWYNFGKTAKCFFYRSSSVPKGAGFSLKTSLKCWVIIMLSMHCTCCVSRALSTQTADIF